MSKSATVNLETRKTSMANGSVHEKSRIPTKDSALGENNLGSNKFQNSKDISIDGGITFMDPETKYREYNC